MRHLGTSRTLSKSPEAEVYYQNSELEVLIQKAPALRLETSPSYRGCFVASSVCYTIAETLALLEWPFTPFRTVAASLSQNFLNEGRRFGVTSYINSQEQFMRSTLFLAFADKPSSPWLSVYSLGLFKGSE
jgi:hypothetical protein